MKYLRCISCGKSQEVEPAVERVWCIECMLSDPDWEPDEKAGLTLLFRTEKAQRKLV